MGKSRLFGSSEENVAPESVAATTGSADGVALPSAGAAPSPGESGGTTTEDSAAPAPALTELEQKLVPQYVKDAAARMDGGVPKAAPKGGEGTLTVAVEAQVPELEPPVPAPEYRAAPTAPGDELERQGFGEAPKFDDLETGARLRARTKDSRSAPIYVGGVYVTREGLEVSADEIRARSDAHLQQFLSDPRIEVELA